MKISTRNESLFCDRNFTYLLTLRMLKKKLEKLNNHVTVSITILQSVSKRTYVYQDSCEIVQFYNFIVSN
jgi:hypothetical protein